MATDKATAKTAAPAGEVPAAGEVTLALAWGLRRLRGHLLPHLEVWDRVLIRRNIATLERAYEDAELIDGILTEWRRAGRPRWGTVAVAAAKKGEATHGDRRGNGS